MTTQCTEQDDAPFPEGRLVPMLEQTLIHLAQAEERISILSASLLGGRPEVITEETILFEAELQSAEARLHDCHRTITRLGFAGFREAASALHHQNRPVESALLNHLAQQISRLISLCASGAQRASQLDRDLSRAITQLREAIAAAGPRLIASA